MRCGNLEGLTSMTQTHRLTDATPIECLPAEREYTIHDSVLPGFGLRVRPSGARTWTLRVMRDRQARRVTLGNAGEVQVERARAKAHAVLARGERTESLSVTRSPTFLAYEALYRKRRAPHWKASTRRSYNSKMRSRVMPTFRARRIGTITRADVARWFHDYSVSYPGGANRTIGILKDMFTRAREWGLLPEDHKNPCRGIKPNRRPPRWRLINEDGLAALGIALEKLSDVMPDMVDVVRLLIYTGCRTGEILSLRWTEVQTDRLLLADSKTGPRPVMLGAPALDILEKRRKATSSPFVFPSPRYPRRPRVEAYDAWKRIRREAGLGNDIRLHDIRHTYASHAIMSGETMLITGRLLGHRRLASTMRYSHLPDTFVLAAAERISGRLAGWLDECAAATPPSALSERTPVQRAADGYPAVRSM